MGSEAFKKVVNNNTFLSRGKNVETVRAEKAKSPTTSLFVAGKLNPIEHIDKKKAKKVVQRHKVKVPGTTSNNSDLPEARTQRFHRRGERLPPGRRESLRMTASLEKDGSDSELPKSAHISRHEQRKATVVSMPA